VVTTSIALYQVSSSECCSRETVVLGMQYASPGSAFRSAVSVVARWDCGQLEAPQEYQDDQNNQYQTQATAREITPLPAVRPARKHPQQHQKNDHNQNGGEHIAPPTTNVVKRIQAVRQAFHGRRYFGDCGNSMTSSWKQVNDTNPRIELSVQKRSH
jgi:hypothetical protein